MLSWWRRRRAPASPSPVPERRLVFVLGGGGSRGACTVGVLRALLEAGIKPDAVVGCSSGAFNAVALASKPDLDTINELAQVWRSIRNRDLFNRNPLRMAVRYVRSHNSFFDSRYLRRLAAMNLPPTFEQLVLPCAVIATNLTRARKEIFTTGSVPDAVAAFVLVISLLIVHLWLPAGRRGFIEIAPGRERAVVLHVKAKEGHGAEQREIPAGVAEGYIVQAACKPESKDLVLQASPTPNRSLWRDGNEGR